MPLSLQASEGQKADQTDDSLLDRLKGMVTNIDESHSFTLAQHRSHQSHASHGSHQSHRSYGYRLPTGEAETAVASAPSRNEMSTPPNSILPVSPATARKLKVLPGNSGKFGELVTRAQIALAAKGYDVGAMDGQIDARTVAALYRYQGDQGMVPDGKLTNEVLSSLGIVAQ